MRVLGRSIGYALAGVAMLGLVACGSDKKKETTSSSSTTAAATGTPGEISMRAGLNDPSDPTIAVLMYLPQSITVTEGTTVSWSIPGPEPHSVTFLPPGQTMPSPESPEGQKLFAPTPAANGTYDGKSLVNSGLVPLGPQAGPPFKLKFPTAGAYKYQCVIHPQMTGTINVVAAGTKADAQADVQSRSDSESKTWLAEGQAAKKTFMATPPATEKAADGTTTWTVQMGTSTAHTDILAFAPVPVAIKARDKVTFVDNSSAPHTASFAGKTQLPQDPTSDAAQKATPGASPQTLNANDFFNTGLLPPNAPPGAGPPLAARSYTYVVPTTGTYAYVCLLHVGSGMAGTITVS